MQLALRYSCLALIEHETSLLYEAMPLLEAIRRLTDYEGMIGEEYLMLIHARLAGYDEKETAVKKILEYIAADEERHQETLKLAAKMTSNKK